MLRPPSLDAKTLNLSDAQLDALEGFAQSMIEAKFPRFLTRHAQAAIAEAMTPFSAARSIG